MSSGGLTVGSVSVDGLVSQNTSVSHLDRCLFTRFVARVMPKSIYLINEHNALTELREQPYDSEALL